MVFDYPDIASLARHLFEVLQAEAPAESPQPVVEPVVSSDAEQQGQIAVVGMACRFPGAPDLGSFWRLLDKGGNAVTDARRDGSPWQGVFGDPDAKDPAMRYGGFVEVLDRFDAQFFGIRSIEARRMDPCQRMLLEITWQALEDAGIDPESLRGSRAGVYVGLGTCEYKELLSTVGQNDSYLGTAGSVAAGRIAFALGLMGPAVLIDTACASSLVTVHQAVAALRQGEWP